MTVVPLASSLNIDKDFEVTGDYNPRDHLMCHRIQASSSPLVVSQAEWAYAFLGCVLLGLELGWVCLGKIPNIKSPTLIMGLELHGSMPLQLARSSPLLQTDLACWSYVGVWEREGNVAIDFVGILWLG